MKNKFDIVTIDWIKQQLKDNGISQKELAKGVNVPPPRVSEWLSGKMNTSGPAKAAIWYFFQDAHHANPA